MSENRTEVERSGLARAGRDGTAHGRRHVDPANVAWKKLLKTIPTGDVANEYVVNAGAAGNINGWPAGVGPATQSEGHGCGMMILALMAGYDPMAKIEFDGMKPMRTGPSPRATTSA